ncbi:hypothetical protein ACC760_38310, partial [Rhizobium ruizarguesonis]
QSLLPARRKLRWRPRLSSSASSRPPGLSISRLRRALGHLFELVPQDALLQADPEVNLKGQRVLARRVIEDPLQRRVRDKAAVPVTLAV